MIFGRKKRNENVDDDIEAEEAVVEADEQGPALGDPERWDAEFSRDEGPFDITEVDLEADEHEVNRLDLACWLVSPEHPLTARVIVNKVWMHLFGAPLAGTPRDFGLRGEAPSHPQLLDWVAWFFVNDAGWSRKQLIREIVRSRVYRQSSVYRPELVAKDPDNQLLARQNMCVFDSFFLLWNRHASSVVGSIPTGAHDLV